MQTRPDRYSRIPYEQFVNPLFIPAKRGFPWGIALGSIINALVAAFARGGTLTYNSGDWLTGSCRKCVQPITS